MRNTNRLPEVIAQLPTAVRAAALEGAQLVAQSAKDRVPVDTGRLRDAIHVEIVADPSDAAIMSSRGAKAAEGGVYVVAGDHDAFYGHIVEHGGVGHPAHPFLVPALEENRPVIEEMIIAAIRKAAA